MRQMHLCFITDKYLLHLQETLPYIPLKISETFVLGAKKKRCWGQIK